MTASYIYFLKIQKPKIMKRLSLLFSIIIFCSLTLKAQIAITEFLCNPIGDDAVGEWVELYNFSLNSVNIKNWKIEDEDSNSETITTNDLIIPSGDFVIIARNKTQFELNWLGGNSNSMVLGVSIELANSADEIIIKNDVGTVIWNLAYSNDDAEGRATFFTEDDFSTTSFGSKATPGVDRDGNDVTNSLGFERNNATIDPDSYLSVDGNTGSPLLGAYTPLPISLTSFSAKTMDGNTVALNWSTASEENNEYFSIEHSTNGRDFKELDQVVGAGTTYESQHYSFIHKNALKGSNYYRLMQMDYDGTFSFSEIEVVMLFDQNEIRIQPTLTQNSITISFSEKMNYGSIEIINWLGQVVYSDQVLGDNENISVNVSHLESGHYIVKISDGNEIKSSRFVKL